MKLQVHQSVQTSDVICPSSFLDALAAYHRLSSFRPVDHIVPSTSWTRLTARDSSRPTRHKTCRRCRRAGLNTQLRQVLFQKVINTNSKHSDALQVTNTITTPLLKPRHTHAQPQLLLPLLRLNHNLPFPHRRLLPLPLILLRSMHQIPSRKTAIIPLLNTANSPPLHTIYTHQMPSTIHIHHTASLDSIQLLPLTSHDADHSLKIVLSAKRSSQIASHGSSFIPSLVDVLFTTPRPTRVSGNSRTMS